MATKKNLTPIESEGDYVREEKVQKKHIETEAEETVLIIPEDENDKSRKICINGNDFIVPTGRPVQVPESVAYVIRNYQRQLRENRLSDKRNENRDAGTV